MSFDLLNSSRITLLTPQIQDYCNPFCCGNEDLDEFFNQEALLYELELLGKTYCWLDKNNDRNIMAMMTLSYNGINLLRLDKTSKNAFQRQIPNSKRHISYPGVLIGRLGVNQNFQGKDYQIGTQILSFLKSWFILSDNKAACRFLIVDAYNTESTIRFYERNGFKNLYKNERLEKESFGIGENEALRSRILYFDLKQTC